MNIGVYTKPLFDTITSNEKWYADIPVGDGFMTAQYANKVKKRFADGTLKVGLLFRILNHYGYDIKEIIWIRK